MAEKFIDLTKLADDDGSDLTPQDTTVQKPVASEGIVLGESPTDSVPPQPDQYVADEEVPWTPETVVKKVDPEEEVKEGIEAAEQPVIPTASEQPIQSTDHWMDSIASTDFVATEVAPATNKRTLYLVALFLGLCTSYLFLGDQLPWQDDLAVVSVAPSNTTIKINRNTVRKAAPVNPADASDLDNPYWELTNPLPRVKKLKNRWTKVEQDLWNAGIQHEFAFQRYHTLNEVRRYRLLGSEEILFKGLKDKKFWTRMRALVALVEFGVPVDIDVVESVIEGARPSLVANYFKRFQRKLASSEAYILRQALKVVDERSRQSIILSLGMHDDHFRNLYLAAALHDPDRSVKSTSRRILDRLGLNAKSIKSYDKFITGQAVYPNPSEIGAPEPETAPTITAKKVTESEFSGKVRYYQEQSSSEYQDNSVDVIEIR